MRNQKYKNRQRHLYTLLFKNGRAYIGQTVDLHHQGEHSRAWFERFDMIHLGDCDGSHAEAKAHEYAWLFVTRKASWTVLARDWNHNTFVVNTRHRMTAPWSVPVAEGAPPQ